MFLILMKKLGNEKRHINWDKVAPAYTILIMAELEEKILEKVDNKPYL